MFSFGSELIEVGNFFVNEFKLLLMDFTFPALDNDTKRPSTRLMWLLRDREYLPKISSA
jgi:hypothetical protein